MITHTLSGGVEAVEIESNEVHRGASAPERFAVRRQSVDPPDYETVVIPVLADSRLLLVGRHRYATGAGSLELPRFQGSADDGGWKVQVEARLTQLAGLRARSLRLLGAVNLDPANSASSAPVVLAEDCHGPRYVPLDATALVAGAEMFTLDELDLLVRCGEVACGVTLAALYLYRSRAR